MKKYFEYEFNEEIKNKLLDYYNNQGLKDFDDGDMKIKLKLDRLKKYIHFKPDDVICDVGCADAVLLRYLEGKYKQAVGLDISEEVIKKDREINLKNTQFYVYDGVNIKTEIEFDKIFLMDVLEHAFEPDQLINSIYNSLKRGGCLIMQVPSTGWLSELIFGKYHYGHLRYYDEDYLRNYLKNVGFEVLHVETFNSVPWSQKFIHFPRLFRVMNKLCSLIPHVLYPYYGSVAAVAVKAENSFMD